MHFFLIICVGEVTVIRELRILQQLLSAHPTLGVAGVLKSLPAILGRRRVYNLHKWSVHHRATEKDRQPVADKLHVNVFEVAEPAENPRRHVSTCKLYVETQHVRESNPQPLLLQYVRVDHGTVTVFPLHCTGFIK